MYKTMLYTISLFFVFIPLISAQTTVARILPQEGYLPGVQFVVKIQVALLDRDIEVVETPPQGWVIGNMDYYGVINDGSITWSLRERLFKNRTITYLVTPSRHWEGEGTFSGTFEGQEISGMNTLSQGVQKPVGIFEHHTDVGNIPAGDVTYNDQTGEYYVKGSGVDNQGCNCHYAYSEIYGSFSLEAKIRTETPSHEWGALLLAWDDIAYEARYYSAWIAADGRAWPCWVSVRGGSYDGGDTIPDSRQDGRLKIERNGNEYRSYYIDSATGEWILFNNTNIHFTDPINVGIAAWSSISGTYTEGYFTDVKLTLTTPMAEGEIGNTLQGMIDAVNEWDVNKILSYFTEDAVYDFVPSPPPMVGKEQIGAFFSGLFGGIPDFHYTPIRILQSDNRIVTEGQVTGTYLGEFSGIPGTGNSVQVRVLHIWEFEGDRIAHVTEYLNSMSTLIQLGVMEAPELPPFEPSFTLPDPEPATVSSVKRLTAEVISHWNNHDLVAYSKMIHSDAELWAAFNGEPMDRDTFIGLLEVIYLASSDLRASIIETLDMGDGWTMSEIMYKGVNDGPYFGIPTTGRVFNVRGVALYRFDEDGLITNFEMYRDEVTLLTQMGVIPSSPMGIFDYYVDIGAPVPVGYGAYDSSLDTYELISGGIGYTRDHYTMYNEVNGDFSLTARIQAEDLGGSATDWAAAGLMVMDDPGSDPEELKIPYLSS